MNNGHSTNLLGPEDERDQSNETPAPVASPQRKPGLLVVDDDTLTLRLLKVGLSRNGFEIWLAGSGEEALACFREHHREIDLVLLDVYMPDQDGPRTLRALQQIDPEVRCGFMTGNYGDYSLHELRQMGAVCFFAKPVDLPKLLEILKLQLSLAASAKRSYRNLRTEQ